MSLQTKTTVIHFPTKFCKIHYFIRGGIFIKDYYLIIWKKLFLHFYEIFKLNFLLCLRYLRHFLTRPATVFSYLLVYNSIFQCFVARAIFMFCVPFRRYFPIQNFATCNHKCYYTNSLAPRFWQEVQLFAPNFFCNLTPLKLSNYSLFIFSVS